jgi:hypothetical protein
LPDKTGIYFSYTCGGVHSLNIKHSHLTAPFLLGAGESVPIVVHNKTCAGLRAESVFMTYSLKFGSADSSVFTNIATDPNVSVTFAVDLKTILPTHKSIVQLSNKFKFEPTGQFQQIEPLIFFLSKLFQLQIYEDKAQSGHRKAEVKQHQSGGHSKGKLYPDIALLQPAVATTSSQKYHAMCWPDCIFPVEVEDEVVVANTPGRNSHPVVAPEKVSKFLEFGALARNGIGQTVRWFCHNSKSGEMVNMVTDGLNVVFTKVEAVKAETVADVMLRIKVSPIHQLSDERVLKSIVGLLAHILDVGRF